MWLSLLFGCVRLHCCISYELSTSNHLSMLCFCPQTWMCALLRCCQKTREVWACLCVFGVEVVRNRAYRQMRETQPRNGRRRKEIRGKDDRKKREMRRWGEMRRNVGKQRWEEIKLQEEQKERGRRCDQVCAQEQSTVRFVAQPMERQPHIPGLILCKPCLLLQIWYGNKRPDGGFHWPYKGLWLGLDGSRVRSHGEWEREREWQRQEEGTGIWEKWHETNRGKNAEKWIRKKWE